MHLPIRTRLTLLSGALVAGVLAALGAFVFLSVRAQLIGAVDAGLRSRADLLLARVEDGSELGGGMLVEGDEAFAQLIGADGAVLASSAGLTDRPLADPTTAGSPRFSEADVDTVEEVVPSRLLVIGTSGGGALVVGASLEDQHEALALLLAQLLIGGPVAVALACGVGWLVAGAALRPVEQLRLEAEAVSGAEPGRRLAVPGTRDELARLAAGLNRMLGRLEEAAERERTFVRDASHELRTPLANLKAELELALRRGRSQDELLAALRSAAEESDRLGRLAEDLLVLARVEGGRLPIRREPLDLARVARDTVASFEGRAAEDGVTIGTDIPARLEGEADGARLRQAIGNLVDNALRHAGRGGHVRVSLQTEGPDLVVEVSDDGDGFDPQFVERAFTPLSRADQARSSHGGAGLGLAIVQAVARSHGGSAEVANGASGGAIVRMRLPAALT